MKTKNIEKSGKRKKYRYDIKDLIGGIGIGLLFSPQFRILGITFLFLMLSIAMLETWKETKLNLGRGAK